MAVRVSSSPVSASTRPSEIVDVLLVSVLAVQLVALFLAPSNISGDDPIRFDAVRTLAAGQWPAMKFSVIPSIAGVPALWLGEALGLGDRLVARLGRVVFALGLLVIILVARRVRGPRYALLVGIGLVNSMLSGYALGYNVELFTATLTAVGFVVIRSVPHALARGLGWTGVVFATASVPVTLIGLAAVVTAMAVRRRSLWPLLALAAAGGITVAEATVTAGHFAIVKYGASEIGTSTLLPWGPVESFGHPVVFGLVAILFSFGRGLFFYLPGVVAVPRAGTHAMGDVARQLALFGGVLIPVYAAWWAWYGGITFGPRFLMIGAFGAAFATAEILMDMRRRWAGVVGALIVSWTAWVGVASVMFWLTPRVAQTCMEDNFRLEPLCWYAPEYSSVFAPFWDHQVTVTWAAELFAGAAAVGAAVAAGLGIAHSFAAHRATVHVDQ